MLPVPLFPVKVDAVAAGVVKDPVQHHPHPQGPRGGAEGAEVLLVAQQRVNFFVIGGVVPVVGVGLKDGVEVDDLHPQADQVGELPADAGQVPAEVVVAEELAILVGAVHRGLVPVLVEDPPGRQIPLGGAGIAEAVREDLVEDGPLHLLGDGEGLINGELPQPPLVHPGGGIRLAQKEKLPQVPLDAEAVLVHPGLCREVGAAVAGLLPWRRLAPHFDSSDGGGVIPLPDRKYFQHRPGVRELLRGNHPENHPLPHRHRAKGGFVET